MLELTDLLWYHWVLVGAVALLLTAGPILLYLLSQTIAFPDDSEFAELSGLLGTGKGTVFIGGEGNDDGLTVAAARAYHAAVHAADPDVQEKADDLDVCIWFAPEKAFKQHKNPNFRGAAAFNTSTGGLLSRRIPLIVIHPDFREEVLASGEPVIHEALHVLRKYAGDGRGDPAHKTKGQWVSVDPKHTSWQLRARELFKAPLVKQKLQAPIESNP